LKILLPNNLDFDFLEGGNESDKRKTSIQAHRT